MLPGVAPVSPAVENKIKVTQALSRSGLLALASSGICLDFGDSSCYGGSGQTLTDQLATANFNLGATGSSEGSDPAFNGTAGGCSKNEYLSFDGGDRCTISGSNPSAINGMHKSAALYTILSAQYLTSEASARGLCGTIGANASNHGIRYRIGSSRNLVLNVGNGSGTLALNQSSTTSTPLPADKWSFAGISYDASIGAGGINYYIDGAHDSDNSTITSPSVSNATAAMDLAGEGNGTFVFRNNERLGFIAILFGHAATAAQFDRFFALMAPRFKI